MRATFSVSCRLACFLLGMAIMGNTEVIAAELSGPLVTRLPDTTACTTGSESAAAIQPQGCDRLALDDAWTTAVIDEVRHEIRIRNDHAYSERSIVADVLLHARGIWGNKARPYLVHLVISKDAGGWHHRLNAYTVPGDGMPSRAEIEGWSVTIADGAPPLLSPELARSAIIEPSLSSRLVGSFAQARDIRSDPSQAPALEISISFGPLKYKVARARLELPGSLRQNPRQGLAPALQQEDWSFELESLSSLAPQDLIRHDLFLFGLNTHPLLQDVMRRGYRADEKLTVGVRDGAGYVRIGQQSSPFPAAQQTAMTFLRDTYVGMVLAAQGKLIDTH
jgi:hypothetical protein